MSDEANGPLIFINLMNPKCAKFKILLHANTDMLMFRPCFFFQECQRLLRIMNEAIERIVLSLGVEEMDNPNGEDVLHQIYTNPAYLENESNEKIREEAEKLNALDMNFKRDKFKDIILEHED